MKASTFFILVGALVAGCSSTPPADVPDTNPEEIASVDTPTMMAGRPAKMLSLVVKVTNDGLVVLSRTEAPNRTNRRDGRARSATFFRVYSHDGTVLEERGFEMARATRGELREADGSVRGVRVPVDEPVFTVTVPLHEGWSEIRFFEASDAKRTDPVLLGTVTP